MLSAVKHLLCICSASFGQSRKVKSGFFVAESILSVAEGFLRMTHESNAEYGVVSVAGRNRCQKICVSRENFQQKKNFEF
jgi:hypothetical protein